MLLACAPVVVLVVVAAVALVVWQSGAGPSESARVADGPVHPETWDPRVAPIAEWVADERNLEFLHPVEVALLTVEDYEELVAADAAADDEEAADAASDAMAVWRALGLIEGDVDLGDAAGDLMSAGSLAFYDSREEKVFVRGDELTPGVRVTLAHELTHVLQDQHFDLGRMNDPDFDRAEGLRAMAEGDADRIEQAYVDEVLSAAERDAYDAETDADVERSEEGLAEVPPAMVAFFSAPYTLGESFLSFVELTAGAAAYDQVLEDPPTEEELMDPAVRGTARAAARAVVLDAPDGAEIIEEDDFGPLALFLLLSSRGDAAEALFTVDGWAGDAYVGYRHDDQICAEVAVVGDDRDATDRIDAALSAWVGEDPTRTATVERAGEQVRLRACDPGPDAPEVGALSADVLAVPYVRSDVESASLAEGASPAQARCAGDAVVSELTVEELVADSGGPPPAEVQQRIVAAVAACR